MNAQKFVIECYYLEFVLTHPIAPCGSLLPPTAPDLLGLDPCPRPPAIDRPTLTINVYEYAYHISCARKKVLTGANCAPNLNGGRRVAGPTLKKLTPFALDLPISCTTT